MRLAAAAAPSLRRVLPRARGRALSTSSPPSPSAASAPAMAAAGARGGGTALAAAAARQRRRLLRAPPPADAPAPRRARAGAPLVVAIDGPAASGKGTIAKRLASEFGLAHLDTGLLYRGVGWAALDRGVDLADEPALADIAAGLDLATLAANPALRGDDAAAAASRVSALPAVRGALLTAQRRFAAEPPGGLPGAVLDGRDVGTVICPDAPVKLYVTADVGVRASRRLAELHGRGDAGATYDAVLADMVARDERDMARAAAPLRPADDALLLDTTALSADDAYARARAAVEAARA
ncbi:cmk [Scenedesmus sp. PABB004]|nr:cmk [Scenedesmus sp. PABB004]